MNYSRRTVTQLLGLPLSKKATQSYKKIKNWFKLTSDQELIILEAPRQNLKTDTSPKFTFLLSLLLCYLLKLTHAKSGIVVTWTFLA